MFLVGAGLDDMVASLVNELCVGGLLFREWVT